MIYTCTVEQVATELGLALAKLKRIYFTKLYKRNCDRLDEHISWDGACPRDYELSQSPTHTCTHAHVRARTHIHVHVACVSFFCVMVVWGLCTLQKPQGFTITSVLCCLLNHNFFQYNCDSLRCKVRRCQVMDHHYQPWILCFQYYCKFLNHKITLSQAWSHIDFFQVECPLNRR